MGKTFLKGLMAVLPIALTLTLILWLLDTIERIFGAILKPIIGPSHYFTGLGILVGLVLIFLVGLFMNAWIVQRFYRWGDRMMKKIPFIKTLYGAISDMLHFLKSKKTTEGSEVVIVTINGMKLLGFITRNSFNDLPQGIGAQGDVAVYLPMSYQIGGYTLILPKSQVQHIDMSLEQAMRFCVTAGMQNLS